MTATVAFSQELESSDASPRSESRDLGDLADDLEMHPAPFYRQQTAAVRLTIVQADPHKPRPGQPKTNPACGRQALAASRGGNDFACNEFLRVQ